MRCPLKSNSELEICILTGGLSSRMGRDKAKLCLGGQTLLDHIRQTARKLDFPIRVLRKDAIPRCGPIGGVYTSLLRNKADAVLFLSCDMPFVSHELLLKVACALPKRGLAAFAVQPECFGRSSKFKVQSSKPVALPVRGVVGFPFVLKREALPIVEQLVSAGRYSLQDLATSLSAKLVKVSKPFQDELFNINTPADWERAREFLKGRRCRAAGD